jgi:hypothetical protein
MFTTFTTCAIIGHGVAGIMFGVIQAANATVTKHARSLEKHASSRVEHAKNMRASANGGGGGTCFSLSVLVFFFFRLLSLRFSAPLASQKVFISYIENPHALHNDHPDAYKKLHKAWLEMGRTEVTHDYAEQWEATTEELAQEAEDESLPPPEIEGQEASGGDSKGVAPTVNPVLTEGGGSKAAP